MLIGEKIKILRVNAKMNQRELADRLKIAKSVISFYESGDRCPSYDVLIRIASIFNVTTDYLLDVEKGRVLDVTGLSDEDIAAVATIIDALKRKNNV